MSSRLIKLKKNSSKWAEYICARCIIAVAIHSQAPLMLDLHIYLQRLICNSSCWFIVLLPLLAVSENIDFSAELLPVLQHSPLFSGASRMLQSSQNYFFWVLQSVYFSSSFILHCEEVRKEELWKCWIIPQTNSAWRQCHQASVS